MSDKSNDKNLNSNSSDDIKENEEMDKKIPAEEKKKNGKKQKKVKGSSKFSQSFKTRAFKAGGYSVAAACIIIAVAIILNVILGRVSSAYTQFDLTSSGIYSISDQTKDTIKGLDKEVDIYYLVSKENEASYVKRLLDKMSSYSDKLKVEEINPDEEPDFASKYTDDDISEGDILVVCGDKSQVVYYNNMVTYEAGSYEYYRYYLQQGQSTAVYWNGEIELLKAIDKVTNDKTYKVYFISTQDGQDFSSMQKLLTNENIDSDAITLRSGDKIPSDASCVILTDLSSDIEKYQADIITDYLSSGGKIYIAVDHNKDGLENLGKVLSSYGVSFTSDNLEDGERGYYYDSKDKLIPHYTGDHSIISSLKDDKSNYVYFPGAMGINSTTAENVTFTPLLQTSESAYISTSDGGDPDFKQFTVGAVIENSKTKAQIVLYGSSSFMSSDSESIAPTNDDLFVNSIGYLCDKDSAINVHAKSFTSTSTLEFGDSKAVPTIVTVILPTLITVAFAAIVLFRRKKQ